MNQRLYKFDNIRFLLMFLVVLGHFLEVIHSEVGSQLYRVIYSFHMPLFIFVSGYFAKYDRNKILVNFIYPYLLFQSLYCLFSGLMVKKSQIAIQFTTPHWILWYLLAVSFCYFLLPMFNVESKKAKVATVIGLFLLGLLAGYENTIGYYLALGRFISFLPFFVLGFYSRSLLGWLGKFNLSFKRKLVSNIGSLVVLTAVILVVVNTPELTVAVFYQSLSYQAGNSSVFLKLVSYGIALVWIFAMINLVPEKKIPMFTGFGRYTLPVYLLHGFIVRVIASFSDLDSRFNSIMMAVAISYLLIAVLSNKLVGKGLNRFFTATWIVEIFKQIETGRSY